MSDATLEFEHQFTNTTVFWPYFTTNSVDVYKEEEAFSFDSLIADIGGVLWIVHWIQLFDGWGLDSVVYAENFA